MEKIVKHTKIIQVIIFTFGILGIINFSFYPSAYTKYRVSENEVLKYSSNIVSLANSEIGSMSLVSFNNKEAILEFSLPKNTYDMGEVNSDVYHLVLTDGCQTTDSDIIFNTLDPKVVRLTCDLTNNNILKSEIDDDGNSQQYLNVSVKVNESVNGEIPFRYKEYNYHEVFHPINTVSKVSRPVVNHFDIDTLRTVLVNSLITKDEYRDYEQEIRSYIDSAVVSDNSFELLGITVNYQEEFNQYTYEEDENFIGYARTYYENRENTAEQKRLFFSSVNSSELDKTFTYYLSEYYNFSSSDISLILNYVKSKGGIYFVLFNHTVIEGISLDSSNSIIVDRNIVNYAYSLITNNSFVIYSDSSDNMKNVFAASLERLSTILSSILDKVTLREDILTAVTTISSEEGVVENYFVIQDEEYNLLLEVISSDSFNTIRVIPFEISYQDNDYVNFIMKYAKNEEISSSEVTHIIDFLMTEFNGSLLDDSLSIIEDNDNYIVSFQGKKSVTDSADDASNDVDDSSLLGDVNSIDGLQSGTGVELDSSIQTSPSFDS